MVVEDLVDLREQDVVLSPPGSPSNNWHVVFRPGSPLLVPEQLGEGTVLLGEPEYDIVLEPFRDSGNEIDLESIDPLPSPEAANEQSDVR